MNWSRHPICCSAFSLGALTRRQMSRLILFCRTSRFLSLLAFSLFFLSACVTLAHSSSFHESAATSSFHWAGVNWRCFNWTTIDHSRFDTCRGAQYLAINLATRENYGHATHFRRTPDYNYLAPTEGSQFFGDIFKFQVVPPMIEAICLIEYN